MGCQVFEVNVIALFNSGDAEVGRTTVKAHAGLALQCHDRTHNQTFTA